MAKEKITDYYNELYYKNRYVNPFIFRLGLTNFYYLWTSYWCLIRPAKLRRGSTALDVGCGMGNLVWAMRKLGINAQGIEPETAVSQFCRDPKHCIYKKVSHLPYPNRKFDLVFTNEVLEHIPERKLPTFLNDLDRVSRGIMIHMVCTSDRGPIIYSDPTHILLRNSNWWFAKLKELGYTVKKGNFFYFFPNLLEVLKGNLHWNKIKSGYFLLKHS